MKPFLKWAGGKYRIIDKIISALPKKKTLIEPFVGSGAVFLNTEYENYVLADANADLISLYSFGACSVVACACSRHSSFLAWVGRNIITTTNAINKTAIIRSSRFFIFRTTRKSKSVVHRKS
jgi:hypothetical protein